jgi:hypothetical protein
MSIGMNTRTAAELRNVRGELDTMAEWRLHSSFAKVEQTKWQLLRARERDLISQLGGGEFVVSAPAERSYRLLLAAVNRGLPVPS